MPSATPSSLAGWQWVPRRATPEMERAGYAAQDKWPSAQCDNAAELAHSFASPRWQAMLDAAPPPPVTLDESQARQVIELLVAAGHVTREKVEQALALIPR